MSETWIGGSGLANAGTNWAPALPGWEDGGSQIQGGATVAAGGTLTFTNNLSFNNSSSPALDITGTGDVLFVSSDSTSHQLAVQNTLQINTGSTLEMENISITTSWLTITGAGTAGIEGGSLTSSGFSLASNQSLLLEDTTYSTTSTISGTGTIILAGSALSATGGAYPSDTILFAKVTVGGAENTLVISNYDTNLKLANLGYGDVIEVTTGTSVDNVTLVANGDGTYSLVDGSNTLSSSVTLAPGATAADFTNTGTSFAWSGATPCFYPGTMLATEQGEIAVEHVTAGTMLKTAAGALLPVRWVGWSEVSLRFADPLRALPIRISAGALADNVPVRDLLVSPDHALFLDGVLVQAGALVNGSSIIREENVPESFRYYHVELATHELLLADGCPAESFVDNIDRMNFHNWDAREAPAEPVVEMDYARVKSTRQLPGGLRQALAARCATPRAA